MADETMGLLLQLAQERGVAQRRDAMFRGEKINIIESRAVLHVALRAPRGIEIEVDGKDVVGDVHCCPGQDGVVYQAGAQRRMEGPYR